MHDESISGPLIAKRKADGLDRYDEVWNGVYVMAPLADNEQQDLVMSLSMAIATVWDLRGKGKTQPGANVSDNDEDWRANYRIPDVLCFSKQCKAINRQSHWLGGPEFAIEITSPGDRTLEKLDFYAGVGTHELLIIDRDPWCLTLYRVDSDKHTMLPAYVSDANEPNWLESQVVPVRFQFDGLVVRVAESGGTLLREIPIQAER